MSEPTEHGDRRHESWSALMDDEVDDLEVRRMLQEADDPDVRARWMRYQVARATLRGEMPEAGYIDLSARIGAALDAEPHPATAASRRLPAFAKPLGSIAIAASVAAVVILGAQFMGTPGSQPDAAHDTVAAVAPPAESRPASPIIRDAEREAAAETVARRQPAEGSRMIIRAAHGSGMSEHQLRHTFHSGGMLTSARVFSQDSDR